MCHKVYRTLARSFRGMYPQSLSVYFSKPLSNKLSLFLLYVIASARGRANIHGVPRRRPSRDSLTLLPERAAACPLTVRRVALCGRGLGRGFLTSRGCGSRTMSHECSRSSTPVALASTSPLRTCTRVRAQSAGKLSENTRVRIIIERTFERGAPQ